MGIGEIGVGVGDDVGLDEIHDLYSFDCSFKEGGWVDG